MFISVFWLIQLLIFIAVLAGCSWVDRQGGGQYDFVSPLLFFGIVIIGVCTSAALFVGRFLHG